MEELKVFKLGYKGKILGYRVAVKSSVLKGVFDLTSEEAKAIGVDKFYSEKVINLIPQGKLLVSKQEIEQNIIIKDISGNEDKLKQVVNNLNNGTQKPNKVYESAVIDKLCKKYMNGKIKQYADIQYIGINIYRDIRGELLSKGYKGSPDIINTIKDKIDIFFARRGFEGCDIKGFEDEMSGDNTLDTVFLLANSEYVYLKTVEVSKKSKAV